MNTNTNTNTNTPATTYEEWFQNQIKKVISDLLDWGFNSQAPGAWANEVIKDILDVLENGPSSDGYRGQEFLSLHPFQGVLDKWQGALWAPDYFDGTSSDEEEEPWLDPDWVGLGRILSRLPGAIPAWFSVVWFHTTEGDPLFVDHNCSRSRCGDSWTRRRRSNGHRAQRVVA